jgi:hypothetical protein
MCAAQTALSCPTMQKARKRGRIHHRGEDSPWELFTAETLDCSCLMTCDCVCSSSSLYTSRSMPTLSDQQEVQPDRREPPPAQANTKSMPHLPSSGKSSNKANGEWSHYHRVNLFLLAFVTYIYHIVYLINQQMVVHHHLLRRRFDGSRRLDCAKYVWTRKWAWCSCHVGTWWPA